MHKFFDHENWLENQPTLKSIFDNLRNYPLLAIFFAVTWPATQKEDAISLALSSLMVFVLIILSIFSLVQTCILFSAVLFHAFLRNMSKANIISISLVFIFTFVFVYAMFFSFLIFTVELFKKNVAS